MDSQRSQTSTLRRGMSLDRPVSGNQARSPDSFSKVNWKIGNGSRSFQDQEDISVDLKYKSCAGRRIRRMLPNDTFLTNCIDEAARVLPAQATLDRFVTQNPLLPFEEMHFDAAISHVRSLEHNSSSPADIFFRIRGIDPRPRAKEALCDLCATFLDKDSARWPLENRERGFLHAFAALEGLGCAPWRKGARATAVSILQDFDDADLRLGVNSGSAQAEREHRTIADKHIKRHFHLHRIPPSEWTSVSRAYLLGIRGWAGLFKYFEESPDVARPGSRIRLSDFLAVTIILMQSSMENLGNALCTDKGEAESSKRVALNLGPADEGVWRPPSKASYIDQQPAMREGLEAQFMRALVEEVGTSPVSPVQTRPELQVWTCIDDRMEALRRELENENSTTETLGVAGFFGVPMLYTPLDGLKTMVCAPVGNCPNSNMIEKCRPGNEAALKAWKTYRRLMGSIESNIHHLSFHPVLSLVVTAAVAPLSVANLAFLVFPGIKVRIERVVKKAISPPKPLTTFDLPWPASEAAKLLSTCLKDIGTSNRFAPLIVILGHGSDSANNPYFSPHNCGACQGQKGDNNARLFARAANDMAVRLVLASEHRITIPNDTYFIGGSVNTSTSSLFLHDELDVPQSHAGHLSRAKMSLQRANSLSCFLRTQHFFLEPHEITAAKATSILNSRGTNIAEIRPELSHSTNAGVVVGRRDLTRGNFLDSRAFLFSYDPFDDDENGTSLQRILTPALVVCSGINLDYLFSASFPGRGSGTKCPMNTVSNIAVMHGTIGDVKPGLPTQMTEMHIPIRLQFIVDAPVSRVQAVLSRNSILERLVRNEWVKIAVRDPFTNSFFKLKGPPGEAKFEPVTFVQPMPKGFKFKDGYAKHKFHGEKIKKSENIFFSLSVLGLLAAWIIPAHYNSNIFQKGVRFQDYEKHVLRGSIVSGVATFVVAFPIIAFSKRYMHGEYMYCRFFFICVLLVLAFNWVATSPNPLSIGAGYSLLGLASTFLIGMYNERPSVRANGILDTSHTSQQACKHNVSKIAIMASCSAVPASFVFLCYKLGDLCMLLAASSFDQMDIRSLHTATVEELTTRTGAIAAVSLIGGAFFKSSQFPIAGLFAMSMEGPTPASALGYAGLSGHMGIVMLSTQMPLWFHFAWARALVCLIGGFTAVFSSFVSQTMADRKGAIAYAISAGVGQLFIVLGIGWGDAALFLAFGHSAFRILQVINVGGHIKNDKLVKAALDGHHPFFSTFRPPAWLYCFAWGCRRFDRDFLEILRAVSSDEITTFQLTGKWQQAIAWSACLFSAIPEISATFIPGAEHYLMRQLHSRPLETWAVLLFHAAISVLLIRLVFYRVLDLNRFDYSHLRGIEKAKAIAAENF